MLRNAMKSYEQSFFQQLRNYNPLAAHRTKTTATTATTASAHTILNHPKKLHLQSPSNLYSQVERCSKTKSSLSCCFVYDL